MSKRIILSQPCRQCKKEDAETEITIGGKTTIKVKICHPCTRILRERLEMMAELFKLRRGKL